MTLTDIVQLTGAAQLSILAASAIVPFRLNWKQDLASLPTLHRQMYWTYGGYVVLGIVTLGALCLVCHEEIAARTILARGVALYGAIFWGVRLALQAIFDVKLHLTAWWLKLGYHTLTLLFIAITASWLNLLFGWWTG